MHNIGCDGDTGEPSGLSGMTPAGLFTSARSSASSTSPPASESSPDATGACFPTVLSPASDGDGDGEVAARGRWCARCSEPATDVAERDASSMSEHGRGLRRRDRVRPATVPGSSVVGAAAAGRDSGEGGGDVLAGDGPFPSSANASAVLVASSSAPPSPRASAEALLLRRMTAFSADGGELRGGLCRCSPSEDAGEDAGVGGGGHGTGPRRTCRRSKRRFVRSVARRRKPSTPNVRICTRHAQEQSAKQT